MARKVRQTHSCKTCDSFDRLLWLEDSSSAWLNFSYNCTAVLQSACATLLHCQGSDLHRDLKTLPTFWGSRPFYTQGIPPNRSLTYAIPSWLVPLRGPKLTQNVCKWNQYKMYPSNKSLSPTLAHIYYFPSPQPHFHRCTFYQYFCVPFEFFYGNTIKYEYIVLFSSFLHTSYFTINTALGLIHFIF